MAPLHLLVLLLLQLGCRQAFFAPVRQGAFSLRLAAAVGDDVASSSRSSASKKPVSRPPPSRFEDVDAQEHARFDSTEVYQDFLASLQSSFTRDTFISIALTKPTLPSAAATPPSQQAQQSSTPLSISGRLVMLKAGLRVQLTLKFKTNEQVKNFAPGDATLAEVTRLVKETGFRKVVLVTTSRKIDLTINHTSGQCRLTESAVETPPPSPQSLQHDRTKNQPIDPKSPFLKELGVTTEGGRPLQGMSDKLRQIERFVEILAGLVDKSPVLALRRAESGDNPYLPAAPPAQLKIVDMGAGLAYLTFAVHSHFHRTFSRSVRTVGVEARQVLVQQCSATARRLGSDFDGLEFVCGGIEDYSGASSGSSGSGGGGGAADADSVARAVLGGGEGQGGVTAAGAASVEGMDVLIALHACDIATDSAIFAGIQHGASVIVTSPCCHKEARRQLDRSFASGDVGAGLGLGLHLLASEPVSAAASASTPAGLSSDANPLQTLLSPPLFRERASEMVTDSIRALCLEHAGYETVVLEFVGGQHTAKNVMIAAVKKDARAGASAAAVSDRQEAARAKIVGLMAAFGLQEQRLAGLLGIAGGSPSANSLMTSSSSSGSGGKRAAQRGLRKM